jgi:hypothetical protein
VVDYTQPSIILLCWLELVAMGYKRVLRAQHRQSGDHVPLARRSLFAGDIALTGTIDSNYAVTNLSPAQK